MVLALELELPSVVPIILWVRSGKDYSHLEFAQTSLLQEPITGHVYMWTFLHLSLLSSSPPSFMCLYIYNVKTVIEHYS